MALNRRLRPTKLADCLACPRVATALRQIQMHHGGLLRRDRKSPSNRMRVASTRRDSRFVNLRDLFQRSPPIDTNQGKFSDESAVWLGAIRFVQS